MHVEQVQRSHSLILLTLQHLSLPYITPPDQHSLPTAVNPRLAPSVAGKPPQEMAFMVNISAPCLPMTSMMQSIMQRHTG